MEAWTRREAVEVVRGGWLDSGFQVVNSQGSGSQVGEITERKENRSLRILKALEEGEGNIKGNRNGNAFVGFQVPWMTRFS